MAVLPTRPAILLLLLAAAPAGAANPQAVSGAAGLPTAVARTRDQILAYAHAGRFEDLQALARRTKGFTYHFGFEKRQPAAFWRAEARAGQDPLPKLAAILRMPHRLDGGVYMWPAAAAANPTPADWEALKPTFPAARVIRWRAEGYTGWRVGIDARGAWTFFVRGD